MSPFSATLPLSGPEDDCVITTRLTGKVANEFAAMLNMNGVRDSQGRRVTFHWVPTYFRPDEWMLEATLHDD